MEHAYSQCVGQAISLRIAQQIAHRSDKSRSQARRCSAVQCSDDLPEICHKLQWMVDLYAC
eukprot:7072-Heterococcus_DN1.PRE.2